MGKISNSINHYLSDNRRFADLFNGICFQGEAVVHAEDLSEGTQVYYRAVQEPEKIGQSKKTKGRKERTRDICKQLKTGGMLRILAVENQEMVDYAMPYRCMEYDVMDFGDGEDVFRECFKDYPMQLFCLNEDRDLEVFHTEVGLLFQALQYRGDRAGLKELMERDTRYQSVDEDTLETMSVMLDLPSIIKKRKKYMEKNQEDKEEYDMCQAIREWAEEERSIGREEGRREGQQALNEKTRIIVRNMLLRGMLDTDIMAIAECDQGFVDTVRSGLSV